MCLRVCLVVHALCGIVYTCAGAILMVTGIFFFISTPFLQLGSNMLTGGLCIVFGVGSILLTCCGSKEIDVSKTDKLLVFTLFVLAVGVANLVILEIGEWWLFYDENLTYIISLHEMEDLAFYAHLVPSLATVAVIAVAFLDAQFLYCTYSLRKTNDVIRHVNPNETVSDIEYIIPRHKGRPMSCNKPDSGTQYTQSWVFDTEGSSHTESPYLKLAAGSSGDDMPSPMIAGESDSLPARALHSLDVSPHVLPECEASQVPRARSLEWVAGPVPAQASNLRQCVVTVQVDSEPEESPEMVNRQRHHMKSFSQVHSRTHSPGDGGFSDFSSNTSAASAAVTASQPPIYECLEKLTQPNVYRPRLDLYISENDTAKRKTSRSHHRYRETDEKTHASLMAELGRSIENKQNVELRSRGSDAEFSKELEAALKLIQDLGSPNTIDTPSEKLIGLTDMTGEQRTSGSGGSSNTISGRGSLERHGKLSKGLAVESQSTSGYNSPSLSDRATPAADGSMACVIRQVGPTAVISIYPTAVPKSPSAYSYTAGDSRPRRRHVRALSVGDVKLKPEEGKLKLAIGKVRGMLGTRRPSLLPDLERAILKSESLAFLTDGELEDRLQKKREEHRRIEAKVKEDMLGRRKDSFSSADGSISHGFAEI